MLPRSLVFCLFAFTVVVLGAMHLPGPLSSMTTGTSSIHVADVNADNALDVLTATSDRDEIVWHRNDNGSFSDHTAITEQTNGVQSIFSTDLDGDGDPDVLSTSMYSNEIAWYENTDGYGSFSDPKVIEEDGANPMSVFATDLDGDGDADVLFASNADGEIAWYENTDEQGGFSSKNVISNNVDGARAIYAADLDSDGDKDVLSASSSFGGVNKIAWYRNTAGGFASQNVISKNIKGAKSVFAVDVDGDGDQDVLSASQNDGKIAWYENTSGYGTFSDQKEISTTAAGAHSVYTADLDGDGDQDVLAAFDKLAWYENVDAQGTFSAQKVISSSGQFGAVFAADLDADGDPDVLSSSRKGDRIAWYSNDIEMGEGFSNPKPIIRRLAEK